MKEKTKSRGDKTKSSMDKDYSIKGYFNVFNSMWIIGLGYIKKGNLGFETP